NTISRQACSVLQGFDSYDHISLDIDVGFVVPRVIQSGLNTLALMMSSLISPLA
ncbi:hypothetical protein H5410_016286, partial [Solanum commersonii]